MSLPWLPRLPAALFAIPVGLFALAGAWRRAAAVLAAPASAEVAAALGLLALAVLFILLALTAAKRLRHAEVWNGERQHPVAGSLMALGPVAVMMAVVFWGSASSTLWQLALGAALALQALVAQRTVRALWSGAVPAALLTPALYLPPVAGCLVGAMALTVTGAGQLAAPLWALGVLAWGMLEWRIAPRLLQGPLPEPVRPTIGVEAAPWWVGTLAASVVWPEAPGWALLGGVCVGMVPAALVLARRRDWLRLPFSAGFWSFSFPLAALASNMLEVVRRGTLPAAVGWLVLALATLGIGYLGLRTVVLMAQGRLLPPAPKPQA